MWQKVKSVIRQNRSFLVTTHVFPDGDAVGSELALALILKKLGKKVTVLNDHSLPKIYQFLDPGHIAKVYGEKHHRLIEACDAALIVDVSTLERMGQIGVAIRRAGIPTVCIDHHRTNSHFADLNVVDGTSASTGEMVDALAKSLRVPITPRMAACLFVSVATDTGWFRFSNTTAHALRIAADLVEKGAKPEQLREAVHETLEWPRMALMKRMLETLKSECGGRIAYFHLTDKMLQETGASQEDTEGFVDIPRVLRGVKVIIFFREVGKKVKVSIRSKSGPRVDELARKHGGGGHARAAGIVMDQPLAKAMKAVLADARRLFDREVPQSHRT